MIIEILILLSGLYMGWNIGGNDAANCVGAGIGSGKIKMWEGIIITSVFCFLGAVLFGGEVIKKIGKGIVPLDKIVSGAYTSLGITPEIGLVMIVTAAVSAGVWVMIATYMKLPVSTSHAIVGAVAGTGLVFITKDASLVKWSTLNGIFISWVATPIGAVILGLVLYKPLEWLFKRLVPEKYEGKFTRYILLATTAYLAFSWGANDVANATGIIAGTGVSFFGTTITTQIAAFFGAIAILIGIVTFGRRVIETMGFGITNLLPIMAIVAQLASALNVTIYTIFGMPVSTSHSIVGAVAGVGLWHGVKGVNGKILRDIALACVGTPFISAGVSFIILKTIMLLGIVGA
ncbi:MAG: inorganic phosphate transporter [Candidatus Thermoplasmatota archaeon]|nr:inorganic phosphate transporter [Candidatus Thermoplasmatota archaeon]